MTVQGRRTTRLVALALATGTLAAAGAGTASAAPARTPQLSASGSASALEITINLPTGVSLPGLGSTITQRIALTDGTVTTSGATDALTHALLGQGATPVLSQLLSGGTTASLTGKTEDTSAAGPAIDQAGLKLALLPLLSKVADPAKTVNGTLAHSSSGIARLAVTGDLLPAQLDAVTAPVQAALAPALDTVDQTAGQATATVAQTVTTAIDTLNGALAATPAGSTTAPLTDTAKAAVTDAVAALDATLTGLTDTVKNLGDATSLVSLNAVSSDSAILRKGDAVTSTVANTIDSLDVLGGLVSVEGITSRASATAGGAPGTGKADFVAPVLNVKVADGALGFRIDSAGATLTGLATDALPAALKPVVQNALGSVNGLLSQVAGIDVAYGKGVTSVAKDGTSAASEVSATTLTINPAGLAALMPAGKKFLTVSLVPAKAVASSRVVAAAPAALPVAAPQALPRTGGDLPLTGAVATGLLGLALVVRRRRSTVSA
ncbi:MAG: hypothetical protein JWN17_1640 [Frankiales bacterium]|nr:hypothetical protein [Frankiales bacterium]